MTFWQILQARAIQSPDKTWLIDQDGRRLTFAGFRDRAERVARGLLALGMHPGATVAWQLPTRIETALLMAALARLGVTQVPIVPLYREREVGFLLRTTRPAFVFTPGTWRGHDYARMIAPLAQALDPPPEMLTSCGTLPESDTGELPPPPGDADAVRWIFSTSGTTADPKGVRHSDATLLAAARGMSEALQVRGDDVCSVNFPIAHSGGPVAMMSHLLGGNTAVLVEVFEPAAAVALYREHGVTLAGTGLPFYLAYLAEQRRQPGIPIIPSLRLITGGGGPKPPPVYAQVRAELGVPIAHAWGMTEAVVLAQNGPDDTDEQRMYTDGRPVRGAEIRILRDDGAIAGHDEEGEVQVRGPMLCKGYTDPALNRAAFTADCWLRTGDLGRLRADGHLSVTGRIKDIVIRKGENISAAEVENVLFGHPAIAEVAVIGMPDPERGERACAVIVARGAAAPTLPDVVRACREAGLPAFKIPEQVEIVDALPRNSMMKVRKDVLRASLSARPWP